MPTLSMADCGNGVNYVVIVDNFSRYPEVIKLRSTTSSTLIDTVNAVFSRHGIPESVRSDNGPQFSLREFANLLWHMALSIPSAAPFSPKAMGWRRELFRQ